MAITGTSIPINPSEGEDKITITEKVTSPYFSDGTTEKGGASFITTSLSADNEKYYFGISDSDTATTAEFNIAYGNVNGKGSDSVDDTIKSPTEVIYKQFSNILLAPQEVTGGFFISRNNGLASTPSDPAIASGRDTEIYVLTARRGLMKDRLNKKNWSLVLTGSLSAGHSSGSVPLHLTDDSVDDNPVATPVGDRYNIVSGSDGTVVKAASVKTYGFYYPDVGVMVFSGAELSASIPGTGSATHIGEVVETGTHALRANSMGFGSTTAEDADYKTALRFANCLMPVGGKLKFRDEEDQVSAQYFCRVKAGHMNFSNNPTFVSGSQNELRHTSMKGNPNTFITQVQLYNSTGDIVAVGNLSTPLKKNFTSEATIKVKLTY